MVSKRWFGAFIFFSGSLVACSLGGVGEPGGAGGEGSPAALTPQQGKISVALVDAPLPSVTAVVVSIDRLTALTAEGEVTLSTAPATIDLLQLQNGTSFPLGEAVIPSGEVSELRLYLADGGPTYVVADGVEHPLEVPSGTQSGIRIPGPFAVSGCEERQVVLDFDALSSVSVHAAGKSSKWMLRPVVKVKASEAAPAECAPATDSGRRRLDLGHDRGRLRLDDDGTDAGSIDGGTDAGSTDGSSGSGTGTTDGTAGLGSTDGSTDAGSTPGATDGTAG